MRLAHKKDKLQICVLRHYFSFSDKLLLTKGRKSLRVQINGVIGDLNKQWSELDMQIVMLMLLAYAIWIGWKDHNNNGGKMKSC